MNRFRLGIGCSEVSTRLVSTSYLERHLELKLVKVAV